MEISEKVVFVVRRLSKIGNTLGVVLPKDIAEKFRENRHGLFIVTIQPAKLTESGEIVVGEE